MPSLNESQTLLQVRKLLASGSNQQAFELVKKLMKQPGGKKNPLYLAHLADCQIRSMQITQALETINKAIKIDPNNAMLRTIKGQSLTHCNRMDEAIESFRAALKINPSWPPAIRGLIEVFFLQNRPEDAYDLLKPIISTGRIDPQVALSFTRVCGMLDKLDEGIALLELWVFNEEAPLDLRKPGLFQLGGLYDKAKRYDDAFVTFNKANELRPGNFRPDRHKIATDRVIAGTTKATLATLPEPNCDTSKAVFILGMPRSGTSLVEQVLSCHPSIHGAGEMTAIDDIVAALQHSDMSRMPRSEVEGYVTKFAKGYIHLLNETGGAATMVTDKNPFNFKHIGVISKVLPGAKIIHCVRNPIDTCVSNYFQDFIGRSAYADSLAGLGSYYNDYHRLMEHWKSVVQTPILDVVYEDVVEDLEANARRMLEFLGVDWDPEVLRFHESKRITTTASTEQVRKPIYQSSKQRWKRYEKHLDPLIEALDPEFRPNPESAPR